MKILLFACLFCSYQANAQQNYNFDSLTTKICESFKRTSNFPDTLRIDKTFEQYAALFQDKSEKEIQELYAVLFLRMQMHCPGFDNVVEVTYKDDTDGLPLGKEPDSKASATTCSKLFRNNRYYYQQGESTVFVEFTETSWKSIFPDGTYSLLSLKKKSPCEFVITYLESNNFIISNSLKKGYQFRYKIIEELPEYFNLVSEDVLTKKKQLFKLFKSN
jgi:hypothetical protein